MKPDTKHALEVRNVTVRFRRYADKKPTLRRAINTMQLRERAELTALDDVSFDVEEGKGFGVIGRNGAGKSTLLRVLAGTLRPNEGSVTRYGKTSTLLSIGVGFNPQLSGRDNVYLGGLAAGLRRAEIDDIFDSVVEYAELEDSIDRAVKTYSSGMFSRLAFSISMHLDPEILLVDEVLAVGDEAFREKSLKAMKDLLDRSGTIVFVSHSLPQVAEFCQTTLWLADGQRHMLGPSDAVINAYKADVRGGKG